jgi:zinc protease
MKTSRFIALTLSVLIYGPVNLSLRAADVDQDAARQAARALYDNIRTETLPNGLRVYLKPIPESPVVTTMVAYKVGSADENLDRTGLSHYLEHLMFKGTNKIMPGDIDRLTLRNGGQNNAYTTEDYTVYHFDFASDRWESALNIEADRMRNLQIDKTHEFEQEKGAVIEELERDEDEPWDLEQKAILPLLFGRSAPYGHPVIGERQHVRSATAEIIKSHYDRWYYPNNAALIVSGGFDPDRAMARIHELFDPIPTGKLPPRKPEFHFHRDHPVHEQISSKFEVPRMLMGFDTIRTGEPGYYALEIIDEILTGGKTGRLYKELVEGKEMAASVASSNSTGRYPGWFSIQVEALKGKNPAQIEELVVAELNRLASEPVQEAELKRAKQSILAGTVFRRESVHDLADSIARAVMTTDLDTLIKYLPNIEAVTAADVQATAKRLLDPKRRVVVWSIPGAQPKAGAGAMRPQGPHTAKARLLPTHRTGMGGLQDLSLKKAKRLVLDNGLILLLLENHRLPIIVASAEVRHVRLLEPKEENGIAALTGRLLDEGTKRHTGPQIAEMIENVGGNLSLSSSGGTLQVLTPDRKVGLDLLFECLSQANFPPQAFAREQHRAVSEILDAERQPDVKGRRVFTEMVYGSHPLGRPAAGRAEIVAKLTPVDCARFHRELFVPNNTIVAVVGDFKTDEIVEQIKRLTARDQWPGGHVAKPNPPPVEKPAAFVRRIITMPEAAQLHFFMGHVGIRRSNPDYYKLLVMDYVLGTGPGFTDRLSSRLRDREGLAYTVSANITSSAGNEPGIFMCYIGTEPKNFERVEKEFLSEISRIRLEKPSKSEVEDAKKYLLGILPFQLTGNAQIAGHLLSIERFQLGFDMFDRYRQAVAAVTPEDVQAVASRYLDPDRMILVAAGPIDASGRSILGKGAPVGAH